LKAFGVHVLVPETAEYDEARRGFWAVEQAETTPYCILQPQSAEEVSTAIRALRKIQCAFGIKSGGHGRCAGESSISDGVLIDLKDLNRVELSEDKFVCNVGPGNTWARVYSHLNPQGLTVVGGRASSVGVGGFCISGTLETSTKAPDYRLTLLLGGISFFSTRHGWALDNVAAFQVVLADGAIVEASQACHPDLYKALRGGGANFGIVTNLTLDVYPYEGMYGGSVNWMWENGDAVINAFLNYGKDIESNRDAAVLLGVAKHKGEWVWHADHEHLKETPPPKASCLAQFLELPGTMDQTSLTSQLERINGIQDHYPPGCHNGFWTFCTKPDKRIMKYLMEIWREQIDLLGDLDGVFLCDTNYVSQNIIDAMATRGGNALGIAKDEPFLVHLMEPLWYDASKSEGVWRAMRTTATKVQEEARRLGVQHDYIYLNYANPFQDVYGSYGRKAFTFLQAVSAKYDPDGIFQHQRQAGWHLHGALAPKTAAKRGS